jgi:hypothetical protein
MENVKGRGSDLRRRRTTPRTSTPETLPNTAPRRARSRAEPDTKQPRPRPRGAVVVLSVDPQMESSDTSLEKLIHSRLLERTAENRPPGEPLAIQGSEAPARRRRANAPTSRIRGAVRDLDPSAVGSGPTQALDPSVTGSGPVRQVPSLPRLPPPRDRSPAAALLPVLLPALAAALAVPPEPLPEVRGPSRGARVIRWAIVIAAALAVIGAAAVLGFAV